MGKLSENFFDFGFANVYRSLQLLYYIYVHSGPFIVIVGFFVRKFPLAT